MQRFLRRLGRLALYLVRPRSVAILVLFAVPSWIALASARGVTQYRGNLALNLGAEFIGSFIVLVAFSPMLRRAQRGQVLEHRRMNFDWYTDRITQATVRIRVMHTFSRLLDRPYDQRFFCECTRLLLGGGTIEILLLAPDSAAARRRTQALGGRPNVSSSVRANLAVLQAYRCTLPGDVTDRLDIRLYRNAPAVTLYQWDDRALISFLPLGGLSGDAVQLETSMESNLGDFVMGQFEELWEAATTLEEYLAAEVHVHGQRHVLPYVQVDDVVYLVDGPLAVQCTAASPRLERSERPYRGEPVAADDVRDHLRELCRDKYDRDEHAFVRLVPAQRHPTDMEG